jgi:hypothetical protein
MYNSPDKLDALEKIVNANIFVWSVRVRPGVANAE